MACKSPPKGVAALATTTTELAPVAVPAAPNAELKLLAAPDSTTAAVEAPATTTAAVTPQGEKHAEAHQVATLEPTTPAATPEGDKQAKTNPVAAPEPTATAVTVEGENHAEASPVAVEVPGEVALSKTQVAQKRTDIAPCRAKKSKSKSTSRSASKSRSQSAKGGRRRKRQRTRRSRCGSGHSVRRRRHAQGRRASMSRARRPRGAQKGDWQDSRCLAREDARGQRKPKRHCRHSSSSPSSSDKGRRRTRSRSPKAVRGRSSRGGAGIKVSETPCWFGYDCGRSECWFTHPNGRAIDEKVYGKYRKGSTASRTHGGNTRKKSRSPSRWAPRVKSPSHVRNQPNSPSQAHSPSAGSPSSSSADAHQDIVEDSKQPADAIMPQSRVETLKPEAGAGDETPKATVLSFRQFALHHLDDSASPEDARSKFAEFQTCLLKKALGLMKGSGLFFDLYNPLSAHRQYKLRVELAQKNSSSFIVGLTQGRFNGLRLVADIATASSMGTCQSSGHLVPPHFAFDPNVGGLVLSSLPPSMSTWKINDFMQSQTGFLAVSTPQRPKQGLTREMQGRFESKDQVRAAILALRSEPFKLKAEEAETAEALEAFVLPPEMAQPCRVDKDMELSKRVVQKLDAMMGISLKLTNALLNWQAPAMEKLDLQVVYLRRVHHFCFYGCEWCTDEWELCRSTGTVLLRPSVNSEDEDGQITEDKSDIGGEWTKAHEQRLENFINTAVLEQPSLPSPEEEPLKSRLTAAFTEKTLQVTPEKHQCTLCGKCFKGPDYVHKHMKKVHHALTDDVLQQVCSDIADTAYTADPARPGWPPAADMAEPLAAALGA